MVNFARQDQGDLGLVRRRFRALGKEIDTRLAYDLIFLLRGPDDKSDWGDREDRGICQGRADHPGGHRRGGHPQLDAVVFRMTDAIGEGTSTGRPRCWGSCTRCRSRPSASCGLWAGRCASSTPPGWPSRRGRGPPMGGAVGAEALPGGQADDLGPPVLPELVPAGGGPLRPDGPGHEVHRTGRPGVADRPAAGAGGSVTAGGAAGGQG